MQSLVPFEPVRAPHRTKRFWVSVALLCLLPLILAPVYLALSGYPAPPLRIQVRNSIITFATWVVFVWIGFRFGQTGWFVVGMAMFALGLVAWFYAWFYL